MGPSASSSYVHAATSGRGGRVPPAPVPRGAQRRRARLFDFSSSFFSQRSERWRRVGVAVASGATRPDPTRPRAWVSRAGRAGGRGAVSRPERGATSSVAERGRTRPSATGRDSNSRRRRPPAGPGLGWLALGERRLTRPTDVDGSLCVCFCDSF